MTIPKFRRPTPHLTPVLPFHPTTRSTWHESFRIVRRGFAPTRQSTPTSTSSTSTDRLKRQSFARTSCQNDWGARPQRGRDFEDDISKVLHHPNVHRLLLFGDS